MVAVLADTLCVSRQLGAAGVGYGGGGGGESAVTLGLQQYRAAEVNIKRFKLSIIMYTTTTNTFELIGIP